MTKKAVVVNDLSGFGKCSLTASVAVLSAMGIQPCPLPTAVLSAQTEFKNYVCKDLTGEMPGFISAWKENRERFDAIYTGYFANEKQIGYALELCGAFKKDGCMLLVDPVMGDEGRLYPAYHAAAADAMKELAGCADIITPNLTELCILTGEDYFSLSSNSEKSDYFERIADAARKLECRQIIVTGIGTKGGIGNLVLSDEDARIIRGKRRNERFSGTGDLFSSVVCGGMLNGKTPYDSALLAARFVEKSIDDTLCEPYDPLYGVNFENNLSMLTEVK